MTTTDEKVTHARSRCSTCGAHWSGIDAFERAEQHAQLERHKVTGLQQTRLAVDRREAP